MAKKKTMFAVYKQINKESNYFGSMFYSIASGGVKVGDTTGDVECVLLSSDIEQINQIIDSIPDEVYYNIARGNATDTNGNVDEELLTLEMWQANFIIENRKNR